MSGLLHRTVLKNVPIQFSKYVYGTTTNSRSRGRAFQFDRHSHQLHDPLNGPVPQIVERSIFKLIHPYNVLRQFVDASTSTSSFQSKLQRALKECALQNIPEWESVFSVGVYRLGISAFRSHFKNV